MLFKISERVSETYVVSNSRNSSMVRNILLIPVPLSGGSTSNEKAVRVPDDIEFMTLMEVCAINEAKIRIFLLLIDMGMGKIYVSYSFTIVRLESLNMEIVIS